MISARKRAKEKEQSNCLLFLSCLFLLETVEDLIGDAQAICLLDSTEVNEHGCSVGTVSLLVSFSPATSSYSDDGSEETMLHEISTALLGQ